MSMGKMLIFRGLRTGLSSLSPTAGVDDVFLSINPRRLFSDISTTQGPLKCFDCFVTFVARVRNWRKSETTSKPKGSIKMLLYLFLILFVLLIGFVVFKLTRVPEGRIPPIVKGAPLVGSAVRFGMDPINLMKEARAEHGDIFTLKVRVLHESKKKRMTKKKMILFILIL